VTGLFQEKATSVREVRGMTERAKFKYSAQDGILELEGSEEFVSKHFESLVDVVRAMARHIMPDQKREAPPGTAVQGESSETSAGDGSQPESIKNYPKAYSEINGKLKIVREIPGGTKRAQMTNAALLYCYGAGLMGDDQVPSKDIRGVCEEHGCIDGPNFTRIFDDKTVFLSDGVKGGNKQIKLTFQGRQKAKELLSNG
jgi:hypothetical protein